MRKPSKRRYLIIQHGQDGKPWVWLDADGAARTWKTRADADRDAFDDLIARTYGYRIIPWLLP